MSNSLGVITTYLVLPLYEDSFFNDIDGATYSPVGANDLL